MQKILEELSCVCNAIEKRKRDNFVSNREQIKQYGRESIEEDRFYHIYVLSYNQITETKYSRIKFSIVISFAINYHLYHSHTSLTTRIFRFF